MQGNATSAALGLSIAPINTSACARVSRFGLRRANAPFFYSLDRVFNIPAFIWQQQGDGEMFVDSCADSVFGVRQPLQLPVELFDDYQGNQSAIIAALSGLRPGATITHGERINSVALIDYQMAIRWATQSAAA